MTMTDWIRPWWIGGDGDHIRAGCPTIAAETDTPQEGAGWLNPQAGLTCSTCVHWKAECSTCGASMAKELEDDDISFTEDDARRWKRDHRCHPMVRITPPHRDTPPAIPPGQQPLFPFTSEDAA